MKALVIGGTGPTGPLVLNGLLERGFDVTIFHRGVHEPDDLPVVRHIHGDAHFPDTIAAALGDERWDVVIAMYGRVAVLAEHFAGKCRSFVAMGGTPAYEGVLGPDRFTPWGFALPLREDHAHLAGERAEPDKFSALVRNAEVAVLSRSDAGAFAGSVIRTPAIHGPRNVMPHEWLVLKRLADGRSQMILPDGGLGIMARCASANAAAVVLGCVDHPDAAAGQAFNCSDDDQYCWRTWVGLVAGFAGRSIEVVSIPMELCSLTQATLTSLGGYSPHTLLDTTKARELLGYREVITAQEQIRRTVEWMQEHPPDTTQLPAWVDPLDYEREDALIAAYRRAADVIRAEIPFEPGQLRHPMPHPKERREGRDEHGR